MKTDGERPTRVLRRRRVHKEKAAGRAPVGEPAPITEADFDEAIAAIAPLATVDQTEAEREIVVPATMTVGELARLMGEGTFDVLRATKRMGWNLTAAQSINAAQADAIAEQFGHKLRLSAEAETKEGLIGGEEGADPLPTLNLTYIESTVIVALSAFFPGIDPIKLLPVTKVIAAKLQKVDVGNTNKLTILRNKEGVSAKERAGTMSENTEVDLGLTARGEPRLRKPMRSAADLGGDPKSESNRYDAKVNARVARELRDRFIACATSQAPSQGAALAEALEDYIAKYEQ